jgi:hypothetical protein
MRAFETKAVRTRFRRSICRALPFLPDRKVLRGSGEDPRDLGRPVKVWVEVRVVLFRERVEVRADDLDGGISGYLQVFVVRMYAPHDYLILKDIIAEN